MVLMEGTTISERQVMEGTTISERQAQYFVDMP